MERNTVDHSQQRFEGRKASPPAGLAAVEYDERFLEASWGWLNDPEARTLSRTPVFTREEQRTWFNSLPHKPDYCIWGMELNGVPIGAMGLKHIEKENAECWAYIGEKSLWGQRIGIWILQELFERARLMGLKRLLARIAEENSRAIRLCMSFGFAETGREGDVVSIEKDLCS
jgi:RimJ/RimL family protein N-acetyltransferase